MWGVILLLHCVATTYAALVVLRLALGAADSIVSRPLRHNVAYESVREYEIGEKYCHVPT
jgi:hypothetical protein